uniref:Uncharacterized protein n=1 Tax=Gouania willdenowi TaxID=441366 RepID=A0A8C5DNH0_GOUWI
MSFLLLSIQRVVQHQLSKLAPVVAGLDVRYEVLVCAQLVGAQGVGAHVLVLCALQREARAGRGGLRDVQVKLAPRETGRIIINVQYLHFHSLLSVYFLVDKEDARICARTKSTTQAQNSRHTTKAVTGTQLPLESL